MAELDVSDAFGPELLDQFKYRRRTEEVDSNGEAVITSATLRGVGVICRAGQNDLERLPEFDAAKSYISVVTQTRLRGVSRQYGTQFKPDLIEWQGSIFQVETIEPYTHFGSGFVQAIAGSVDSVDEAPQ